LLFEFRQNKVRKMVSNRIMKRRGRAKIGTLIAIILILVPLPIGAYMYSELSGYSDSAVVFTMDGISDDVIFNQAQVEYDNVTDEYSYTRFDVDGGIQGNFTSDLYWVNFQYTNATGAGQVVNTGGMSYTGTDQKVFCLLEKAIVDPAAVLEFGVPLAAEWQRPNIGYVTVVSPQDMIDNGVDTISVYFENNQALNLTYTFGVYDYPESGLYMYDAGINGITENGVESGTRNLEIMHQTGVKSSVNGSWTNIEIPGTALLSAATAYKDGYVFITVSDVDGSVLEPANGVLMGLKMSGHPESPGSMSLIWQGCLVVTGVMGLLGAIIATPYMSIEGLTGDGLSGQRYKKGYNPRKTQNNNRRR